MRNDFGGSYCTVEGQHALNTCYLSMYPATNHHQQQHQYDCHCHTLYNFNKHCQNFIDSLNYHFLSIPTSVFSHTLIAYSIHAPRYMILLYFQLHKQFFQLQSKKEWPHPVRNCNESHKLSFQVSN